MKRCEILDKRCEIKGLTFKISKNYSVACFLISLILCLISLKKEYFRGLKKIDL